MNVHKNAKLTPRGRAEIVRRVIDQAQIPQAVATASTRSGIVEPWSRKIGYGESTNAGPRSRGYRRLF